MAKNAQRARARSRNGNGPSAVVKAPDVLGDEGRTELVRRMLVAIQQQRFVLERDQVANGFADDDAAPFDPQTGPHLTDEGEVQTIAQRRQHFNDAEQRLIERYPDAVEAVRKSLDTGGT